jgi:hypothetical protein
VLKVLALREGERLLAQVLPHHVQVQQLLPRKVQPPELHAVVMVVGGEGGRNAAFVSRVDGDDDDPAPPGEKNATSSTLVSAPGDGIGRQFVVARSPLTD